MTSKIFYFTYIIFILIIVNLFFNKRIEKMEDNKIDSIVNELYTNDKSNFFRISNIIKSLTKSENDDDIKKFSIKHLDSKLSFNFLPTYSIIPFHTNDKTDVDDMTQKGWIICDGRDFTDFDGTSKKTPDLTKRFILGTDEIKQRSNAGDPNSILSSKSYNRRINSSNYPDHSHYVNLGGHSHNKYGEKDNIDIALNVNSSNKNSPYVGVSSLYFNNSKYRKSRFQKQFIGREEKETQGYYPKKYSHTHTTDYVGDRNQEINLNNRYPKYFLVIYLMKIPL